MRYLSLFSGIEAASVAWKPLGWECVGVAEIEPFPVAVLKHHYPDVPQLGSVTDITEERIKSLGHIDLIVGGFPCQDLSVAGKRKGMVEGETRSGLFFDAMRIVRWARRNNGLRWLLVENVPGIFSSRHGRDFAALVGEMVGGEFGVPRNGWQNTGVALGEEGQMEWCVLDAQWFGVAQRRRRLFALADFGNWADREPVLLERDCLLGNFAPQRQTREVAPTIPSRSTAGGGLGTDFDCDGGLRAVAARMVAFGEYVDDGTASAMKARDYKDATDLVAQTYSTPAIGHIVEDDVASTITKNTGAGGETQNPAFVAQPVPHAFKVRQGCEGGGKGYLGSDELAFTISTHQDQHIAQPIAFAQNQLGEVRTGDVMGTLNTNSNASGRCTPMVAQPIHYRKSRRAQSTEDHETWVEDEATNTLNCFDVGDIRAVDVVAQPVAIAWDEELNASVEQAGTLLRGGQGGRHDGVMQPVATDLYNGAIDGDVTHSIRVGNGNAMGGVPSVMQPVDDSLYNQGITQWDGHHANATQTRPAKALRALRQAVGEEAITVWGLGILAALQPAKVLQQHLHGAGFRSAAFSRSWVVYCALSRPEDGSGWLLQSLRETGCEGCPPQGWEPSEQLCRELGAYLSELSQPGPQAARFVRDLWIASEGSGVLRQALSAVQEVGRSAGHQRQSICSASERIRKQPREEMRGAGMREQVSRERVLRETRQTGQAWDARPSAENEKRGSGSGVGQTTLLVRRLVVEECEFLQGFPRGYTAIPWRGKPASECPDGPRYKALGNSFAVPVVRWIGERIAAVSEVTA